MVSLLALLLALLMAALLIAKPWEVDRVESSLSTTPGLGVALGDAVEVTSPDLVAVAPGRPVPVSRTSLAAAPEGSSAAQPDRAIEVAVSPARPVARVGEGNAKAPPVEAPTPAPSPQSQPSPEPVSTPVAAPTPAATPAPAPTSPTRVATGEGAGPQGPVGAGAGGQPAPLRVSEGGEYALSFSLFVEGTAYEEPGVENSVLRFVSATGEEPSFALQLWDDGSGAARGLWSSGEAAASERFLAPLAEGEWHEVTLYFRASSAADGFYLVVLDGQPIDGSTGVSLIEPGSDGSQVEVGLRSDGEAAEEAPGAVVEASGPDALGSALP